MSYFFVSILVIQQQSPKSRPVDAFPIFCKRYRSMVKQRYPHLENTSITKILSVWWAALDDVVGEIENAAITQTSDQVPITPKPPKKRYLENERECSGRCSKTKDEKALS